MKQDFSSGIQDLIYISQLYGQDKRFVIAGGGNTSCKNREKIWVKASGTALATITEEDFAVLDRSLLDRMSEKAYSADPAEREEQVKNDLAEATLTKGKRPSVETSMHNIINYPFVVHLHPTAVNGLMCARNAASELKRLFGEKALYVEYTDPGYTLFKKVYDKIKEHRTTCGEEPQVIWLQNHGLFVAAPTIEEIQSIYSEILQKLEQAISEPLPAGERETSPCTEEILPALRMILSADSLKTLKVRNNELIKFFYDSTDNQKSIARPFTPDAIVYCQSHYIFLNSETPEALLEEALKTIPAFTEKLGYQPKVLLIKGIGLVAVGDSAAQSDIILDLFEDAMKIALLSQSFGGAHPMTPEQVHFIDNWEVENYRRNLTAVTTPGRAENKTIVITGAAQGFGEGIGRNLLREGANIVIADLNEEAGKATAQTFNRIAKSNSALFVKTNVAEPASIRNLIHETVCHFGAIDSFISNAGVLRAGGLDDMTPENFDHVTKINYNAYFYCTKAVGKIMKLQTKYAPGKYYADIIQINSKSGLQGSKANFAYAGGKFGGIGLTQSFALELAPYRIKVNAICPGNFYEGPLWSDPENGLFEQYLKAGKVPGAKTIDDVKAYYLSKVPMRKGCTPEDVTKATLYLMEQCGETGQALPVTGGQVMLA
ncbi:MAG: SDR family NAD(P)-dependent oxidoreductase [Proteiniphilum sp.]|jgi:rhamnose utilization protein RhaD (predicted bifunctional aldolase and dehydrogenase)/NAD(P)-dependent dehydrogenase (short-subunit alcohol dehydrogenase family)|nr:SDR family NAD(P)-dependent oxidoreductase [Proteiniphilum sp.]